MTSEGSSALLCGGIVSWSCLLSSVGPRGCVKVGWNGYSSYFMCFRYWKQNRAKDSVSEPLYRTAPDAGVAAVCLRNVVGCDTCMGQGSSEHRLRQLVFQQGC